MRALPCLGLILACSLSAACAVTGARPQPDGLREFDWQETKLVFENRGGGDEALVFVHGWAGDHTVWAEQLASLQPWRRIAVDLPGHGASDKPRIEYTLDYLAQSLLAVLDHAQVSRAVLVGHSNGTPLIRQFLRLYPERVAGLVVVDGPLRSFFADPAQAQKFLEPLSGPGWKEWAERMLDAMLLSMPNAAARARVRAAMLATPQRVMLSTFQATLDPELWREDPIRVPLLLVLARQPAWDESYRALVARLAPSAQYEVLEGVSHFLMLDEPAKFDALVRGFLVRTSPFGSHSVPPAGQD